MEKKNKLAKQIKSDFSLNKQVYLMLLPVILYYLIFHYGPMYGAIIAFKDFNPAKGIIGSKWIGLKHFTMFFNSHYFTRLLRNTLLISLYGIIFSFPTPIILALLLNEIRNKYFKSVIQTVTYMPRFISIMVIAGLIKTFVNSGGLINNFMVFFGWGGTSLLMVPEFFRTIFITSEVWQYTGWFSIIYLSALSSIDGSLYEAAIIDGANRWKQTIHITLPSLIPTIVVLLILRVGQAMNVGFEKIILLYNPVTYETGDVIASFVYRKGLLEFNYSYSSAVGLFQSVINFILLISANTLSKKLTDSGLW